MTWNGFQKVVTALNRKLKLATDLTFYCGVGLGLYALISIYMGSAGGACPVDARRPLMYAAVGLLLVSIVGQFFVDRQRKLEKAQNEEKVKAAAEAEEVMRQEEEDKNEKPLLIEEKDTESERENQ